MPNMKAEGTAANDRILVVDDNRAIHTDFSKILQPGGVSSELEDLERELFGSDEGVKATSFDLEFATQGQEALEKVRRAHAEGRPFATVFLDVRMPPGWDGIETAGHLLPADPDLQVVICTAYSDHRWDEIAGALGDTDRVLILKKPFDSIEVRQLAHTLKRKWELGRQARSQVDLLERAVRERTSRLQETLEELTNEMELRQRTESHLRLAQRQRAVGELAVGIAHEINTPLQFVGDNVRFLHDAFGRGTGLLDEYREGMQAGAPTRSAQDLAASEKRAGFPDLEKQVDDAFTDATEGLGTVRAVVSALQSFGAGGGGELHLLDLNREIETVLTLTSSRTRVRANIQFTAGRVPTVTGDAQALRHVILELINNALDALTRLGREGRGSIEIETGERDGIIFCRVHDDGCGIAPEAQERVFDPCFTTKPEGEGRGYGLTIAHAVVERHGGVLAVESQVGRGTTVEMRLPVDGAGVAAKTARSA